jgi:hypothetical protein
VAEEEVGDRSKVQSENEYSYLRIYGEYMANIWRIYGEYMANIWR